MASSLAFVTTGDDLKTWLKITGKGKQLKRFGSSCVYQNAITNKKTEGQHLRTENQPTNCAKKRQFLHRECIVLQVTGKVKVNKNKSANFLKIWASTCRYCYQEDRSKVYLIFEKD